MSRDRRRRRLLEDAKVRMDALSVRRLLAVAALYVVGLPVGARCAGIADAGNVVGKGWLNWTLVWFWFWFEVLPCPWPVLLGAMD